MKNILIVLVFETIFYFIASESIYAQRVTFGIVTDVHYAQIPDNGSRKYSASLAKMQDCVDSMDLYQADFLVELGDFKDLSQPADETKTLSYLSKIESVFSEFNGKRYHVLGNHDMDCIGKNQFLSKTKNSSPGKNLTWYSFNEGGFHFVVLDSNFDSLGRPYSKGNYDWGDANIPDPELNWLRYDLTTATDPTIVFIHHLLDGKGAYAVRNAAMVRDLFDRSGKVKCVFQGHYHEGRYSRIKGIHYYTLRCLVDGDMPSGNSFAIVTAGATSIAIRGFHRAVSMILPINTAINTEDEIDDENFLWEPWEEQF
jgi:3',5'-cyclic AMP phosphodiesterase CpdA